MDADLRLWKKILESAPREALLVMAVAVLQVLAEKHDTKIVLS